MTAKDFFNKVNDQVQTLFDSSLEQNEKVLNVGLDTVRSLQIWFDIIPNSEYKILINNSIQSLEIALLSQTYCLYRNAFSSLRLAMEMLFGGIYFSTNLIDFIEWSKSKKDLNWSTLNDFDKGVLSIRFSSAFFEESNSSCSSYYTLAKDLYRDLSEYVHGNHHTWSLESESLKIEKNEIEIFEKCLIKYNDVALFILCLRYLKSLTKDNLEKVEPTINQSHSHIVPIHNYLTIYKNE